MNAMFDLPIWCIVALRWINHKVTVGRTDTFDYRQLLETKAGYQWLLKFLGTPRQVVLKMVVLEIQTRIEAIDRLLTAGNYFILGVLPGGEGLEAYLATKVKEVSKI